MQDLLEIKQQREDKNVENDAKAEAYDMFLQWKSAQNNPKLNSLKYRLNLPECPVICIPKPRRCIITEYTKSKYNSEDYAEIRKTEFARLRAEYRK